MAKRMSSKVIAGLVSLVAMADDSISWHRKHGSAKKTYAEISAAREYANDLIRRYNARVEKRASR